MRPANHMRLPIAMFLVLLLLLPSVSACSFIAERDGGNTVRVHDIRNGLFGFAGDVQYTFNMGNGDSWQSEVYSGSNTPDSFIYDFGEAGTFVVEMDCHYLDDDTWDSATPTSVTVGGAFAVPAPSAIWLIAALGAAAVLARKRLS